MSLTVKAYLEKSGQEPEIRRFPIPADVSSSYDYLNRKIADVFPNLSAGNFALFWRDDENDLVRFSSDDELMSALSFRQGDVFKVFVHIVGEEGSEGGEQGSGQVHPNITCDGCEGRVIGIRYKCYVCPDYDLCSTCEAAGTHSMHEMLKIPAPKDTWMGFIPPPPHFRRWMGRFMKRWHNQHPQAAAGCPTGAPEEKPSETEGKPEKPNPETASAEGEEEDVAAQYLQDVGESVAAMLDPLGIDVAVDVETGGRRTRMKGENGRGRRGHGPWGRGPWGHGPWGHGPWGPPPPYGPGPHGCPAGPFEFGPGVFGGCGRKAGMGGQCKKGGAGKGCGRKNQKEATAPKATPNQEKEATPTASPQETEPMEAQSAPVANLMDFIVRTASNEQQASAPKESSPDSEWTVVTPSMSLSPSNVTDSTPGETQSQEPVLPTPMPSDPKIDQALQQMMEMGFSNEGGWLTRLVEMKNGDISQCLDAIKPLRVVESTGERRA